MLILIARQYEDRGVKYEGLIRTDVYSASKHSLNKEDDGHYDSMKLAMKQAAPNNS